MDGLSGRTKARALKEQEYKILLVSLRYALETIQTHLWLVFLQVVEG
jgi:hypothetical protein